MLRVIKRSRLLLGIGLPMIEALIPALPLIVFVLANAVAFGFGSVFFIHGLDQ